MSVEAVVKTLEENLKKAADHLKTEYAHLQIGRASSALVERVFVEAYGVMQPLKAIANISVPDAKTIQIQPWDRGTLQAIEKAIILAEIGLNPQNDGIVIRLNVPALTEERRRDLTKIVSKMAEETKITVRNVRQESMEQVKKMQKDSLITEDQLKHGEKKIQEVVDQINREIESSAKDKEQDIMKV
ncbi:MAG: ribosome recycling factor [Candidatus Altimarinota bacterium]